MSSRFNTSYFSDIMGALFERRADTGPTAKQAAFSDMVADLFAAKSEAQEQQLARAILKTYRDSDAHGQLAFFQYLTQDLDVDAVQVQKAAARYAAQPTAAAYASMFHMAEAPRVRLFRLLANTASGVKCLVKIRADMRKHLKTHPEFARVDHDIKRLLVAWFNRGFLVMRPISWQTSAHVLEKIIAYEAVHAIRDWDDLRRRLHPNDRRCYAFFHPRMPDDPIIFVEVALTAEMPDSIDAVLAEDRSPITPDAMRTATFYSISNCHAGLAGISFGNALIKQVARDLAAELPQLDTFVTLSPIPGLSKWLPEQPDSDEALMKQAAAYLAQAKVGNGAPLDPVARFHLGNGASLHRVNVNANTSPEGQKQSYRAMVNYLYELDQVEARAEGYADAYAVHCSSEVKGLLNSARKKRK